MTLAVATLAAALAGVAVASPSNQGWLVAPLSELPVPAPANEAAELAELREAVAARSAVDLQRVRW